MNFVENVIDLGAQEVNVTGIASIDRISHGQVRVTYFVRRKGETVAAIHLVWDRYELLAMQRVLDHARANILTECAERGFRGDDSCRGEAH
jgi:hypothetical protein